MYLGHVHRIFVIKKSLLDFSSVGATSRKRNHRKVENYFAPRELWIDLPYYIIKISSLRDF